MNNVYCIVIFVCMIISLIVMTFFRSRRQWIASFESHKTAIPDIPKNVIMTVGNMTDYISANIEFLRAQNPTWKFYIFRDDDIEPFLHTHFDASTVELYRKINPLYGAARADFFRYLAVYALGGVYLDAKSSCDRPLDDIVLHGVVDLILWNNGHRFLRLRCDLTPHPNDELCQWVIIAPRHSPILKRVIDDVKHNLQTKNGKGWDVLHITGPHQFTRSICAVISPYKWSMRTAKTAGFVYCRNEKEYKKQNQTTRKHYSQLNDPIIL